MSERMQSAADRAKEVAAKRKGEVETAAQKAEAYLQDDAAKAKDRLAEGPPRRRGKAG
jgi:hypothetical protein